MLQRKLLYSLAVLAMVCVCGVYPAMAQEGKKLKVLVVMSYEENNPWCMEIKEGIDSVLAASCDMKYVYMDTKKDPQGGPKKAEEAFSLYQSFQPDGVITADDNAQSMFVVRYLKDKVKTPIMFNGVNDDSAKYGYPNSHISGILEVWHIAESLALAKQLNPNFKTVGFIAKESESGRALSAQVQKEAESYPIKFAAFKLPKTVKDLETALGELKSQADVLFMDSMEGITDDSGKPLNSKELVSLVLTKSGKPLIGANRYHLEQGALCAVIKLGQEQGKTSAEMLLKAMQGTPVSQLPVVKNHKGKRILNVTVLKALGIKPDLTIVQGSEIVKTKE